MGGRRLVGLVAAYCNDRERRIAYVTSVSVVRGHGRAEASPRTCWATCIEHARELDSGVSSRSMRRQRGRHRLYEKAGFRRRGRRGRSAAMSWTGPDGGRQMSTAAGLQRRDQDTRGAPVRLRLRLRRDAPLHDQVVRALLPSWAACSNWAASRAISPRGSCPTSTITCVEASGAAIRARGGKLGDRVGEFVNATLRRR